jgi:beta-glucosidase
VRDGLLASHHLLLAHGRSVQELRSRGAQHAGITLNLTNAEPVDAADDADLDAARRIDGQFNRWFLDPLFRSAYPVDVVEDIRAVDPSAVAEFETAVRAGDLATISTPIDFLGVNYYHGEYVAGVPSPALVPGGDAPTDRRLSSPFPSHEGIHWHERGLARTSMGWEVDPAGLATLLRRIWDGYAATPRVPLYVTENGAAYDDVLDLGGQETRVADPERVAFLRGHLGAVRDALESGVDVRGYFYWSLLDNYEWAWGYAKRFGIVHVDYDTQVRTVKDSGRAYARIIAERAV